MDDMELFKPRVLPRGPIDAIISLAVGLLQAALLFGMPAALVTWVTGRALLGGVAFLALYSVWLLFTVSKVEVSATGLRFVRTLGSPGLLPWADIESIAQAPRGEVVFRGWLWPLFPAREMTPSLTALGHFRVRFGSGTAYFPPADSTRFEAAVRRFCERAV